MGGEFDDEEGGVSEGGGGSAPDGARDDGGDGGEGTGSSSPGGAGGGDTGGDAKDGAAFHKELAESVKEEGTHDPNADHARDAQVGETGVGESSGISRGICRVCGAVNC